MVMVDAPMPATNGLVAILSEADIVTARQQGRTLAARLGFSLTEATLVATVISELARNILMYAGSGTIVLQTIDDRTPRGILIVASDHGPGIADVRLALSGGYSTSGGLGLGGLERSRIMRRPVHRLNIPPRSVATAWVSAH